MNQLRCMYAPNYKLISCERSTEDGVVYTAYGIACSRIDIVSGRTITRTIEDISSDPELVGSMVNLFNLCCLSLDCFSRAVVDLIA